MRTRDCGADCHSKAMHIITKLMPAGMKIRFANLIKGLRQLGDDVMVVTPCINPPKTFHGAKVLQRPAHVLSSRSLNSHNCRILAQR